MGEHLKLPDTTPYKVEMLVLQATQIESVDVSAFGNEFLNSEIGVLKIKAVKDIDPADLAGLSDDAKRALNFSNSVIVDAGQGITALVDAVPQQEQEFSTSDINRALVDAGLISEGRVMKMGTGGAVVEGGRGAEVIEATIFDTRDGVVNVMSKTKAAWSDDEGGLHVTDLDDDRRVLLENEFLVEERTMRESNALALQVDVESDDVDLYRLLANAAEKAGLKDYTVRCTIDGPFKAKIAVISALPDERIETMEGVEEVLVVNNVEADSVFHFTGTRSDQVSRHSERWGEITGNPVYSPDGHYHGYSTDGKVGGHILEIKPQRGSKIMMIVEPARVAQVVSI